MQKLAPRHTRCGHPLTMFSLLYCPFSESRKSVGEERQNKEGEKKPHTSTPPIYICSGKKGYWLLFPMVQTVLSDHSVSKWSSDNLLGTLQPLGMKIVPRVLHRHTHMHTSTQAHIHTSAHKIQGRAIWRLP